MNCRQLEDALETYCQCNLGRRDRVLAAEALIGFLRERALALDELAVLAWLQHLVLERNTLECVMMRLSAARPFFEFLAQRGVCGVDSWVRVAKRPDLLRLLRGARRYDDSGFSHSDSWSQLLLDFESHMRGLAPLHQARVLRIASDFGRLIQEQGIEVVDESTFLSWLDARLARLRIACVYFQVVWLSRFCDFLAERGRCARHLVRRWRRDSGVQLQQALELRKKGQAFPGRRPRFQSLLAVHFEGFIAFKRDLGRKYDGVSALQRLDRFLCQQGLHALDGDSLGRFVASLEDCKAATRKNMVGQIRDFLAFLRRRGVLIGDLGRVLPRFRRPPRRQYIFTLKEIAMVLGWIREEAPTRDDFDRRMLATLLHLVYACGLRISEALRVAVGDVGLEAGTLFIRRTKFGKDRLIPLGKRMGEVLATYHSERVQRFGTVDATAPFFVYAIGSTPSKTGVSQPFKEAQRRVGVTDRNGRARGRVHDWRHSFAVHRLYKWYLEGADPKEKLILLSLYMGHVEPEYTQHYLHLSQDLLRVAGRPLEQGLQELLPPEVDSI